MNGNRAVWGPVPRNSQVYPPTFSVVCLVGDSRLSKVFLCKWKDLSHGRRHKGRPFSIDAARVRELKVQGMVPTEIAKALKIGRASVYRVLGSDGH